MKKTFSKVAGIAMVFVAGLFLFSAYNIIFAAVPQTPAPAGVVTPSQTIKASSADTAVIRFQITGDNADNTVTQVVVSIESTAGPTVTGDFTNLKVYKSADNALGAGDTVVGTQTTVNVGATTTITVTDTIGAAASWYIVTASTSAGAVNGHAFKAAMAANAITTGGTGGAAIGSVLLAAAVQALTVDTTAPTVNANMTGPANNSTG